MKAIENNGYAAFLRRSGKDYVMSKMDVTAANVLLANAKVVASNDYPGFNVSVNDGAWYFNVDKAPAKKETKESV